MIAIAIMIHFYNDQIECPYRLKVMLVLVNSGLVLQQTDNRHPKYNILLLCEDMTELDRLSVAFSMIDVQPSKGPPLLK